ncbi:MAG: hypothetical protein ACYCQI_03955 [Gammaproteobacteria bacterium]
MSLTRLLSFLISANVNNLSAKAVVNMRWFRCLARHTQGSTAILGRKPLGEKKKSAIKRVSDKKVNSPRRGTIGTPAGSCAMKRIA